MASESPQKPGVFYCPGCKEPCPFPSQVFDHLPPGADPSDRQTTCGCGMKHKLTMAKGAVSEIPEGVTLDVGWRTKKDAMDRAARIEEQAKVAKELEGKCHSCRQPLPPKAEG